MRIQHKIYHRSFQYCALSFIKRKTAAGYLCTRFKIKYVELFAKLHMVEEFKITAWFFSPDFYLNIFLRCFTIRNIIFRKIWNIP